MKTRTKCKILIVDDERSCIDALIYILKPKYSVYAAKDGKTALKIAGTINPDLILLDIVMEGMSGFELLSELKNTDETRNIPVIIITGSDSVEDEKRGFLLGAVDYITKPFHDAIVEARVGAHLQIVTHIRMIEKLCMMDALMNLPNRRGFDSYLSHEWERARRHGTPLSILMIDIDRFKEYNDKYGHPQGDALLTALTPVFEESIRRSGDFIARWGGEEFAALLPNTFLNGALKVAERLRVAISKTVVKCADGTDTTITVSIGVNSVVPDAGDTKKEFIHEADKALYMAKAEGKNTIRVAKGLDKMEGTAYNTA